MPQSRLRHQQQTLFQDPPAVPAVRLPAKTEDDLRDALTQWIQALADAIGKEARDE